MNTGAPNGGSWWVHSHHSSAWIRWLLRCVALAVLTVLPRVSAEPTTEPTPEPKTEPTIRPPSHFVVGLSPFTTMELPRGIATEHVVGVCFNPNDSVRLRLDYHHGLLPRTEDTVDFLNFSWSISF